MTKNFVDNKKEIIHKGMRKMIANQAAKQPRKHSVQGALNKKGAAQYLAVSTRTVDNMVQQGRLKKRKLGTKTLFLIKDLDRFLESLPSV